MTIGFLLPKQRSLLLGLLIAALLCLPPLLQADLETGLDALEEGDTSRAARELQRAAEAGNPYAQFLLARLYQRGRGVLQDYVEAHRWFNLAAAAGITPARTARDLLASQMTSQDVARAQALARQFSPRTDTSARPAPAPPLPTLLPTTTVPSTAAASGDEEVSEGLVARVQLALKRVGYNLELNGRLDERTAMAIRDYQLKNIIDIDGRPSLVLLNHIQERINESQPLIAEGEVKEVAEVDTSAWRRILIEDQFRDGDYTRNPAWDVVAGRFWIESGEGLRTAPRAVAGNSVSQIATTQRISSSFYVEVDLSAQENSGRLEFGPYLRSGDQSGGYRLRYIPGEVGTLAILKATDRSAGVIEQTRRRFDLANDRLHRITWSRDEEGLMVVSVNGTEMLRVEDRAFAGGFQGFVISNHGGDYGIRRVRVKGTS